MVVEFAYGVYVNTNALHNWQISQKLSLTAKSATTLAAKLVSTNMLEQYKTKSAFDISQKIPFENIDGIITLRIEDENAKFNLNSLKNPDGYAFFVRLLKVLDINPDIANIVSYWINSSTEHRPQNAGNIQSKNAYLDSIDELLLIPGIDRESYDKLLPYVTIYGSGEGLFLININTAEIPALMSLSDAITRDMAERVVTYRQLTPFTDNSQIQKVAGFESGSVSNPLMGHIIINGSAFHIISTAESGGIKRIIESVLQGGKVSYWKEM
jgi:type II secretory pathway component PulK